MIVAEKNTRSNLERVSKHYPSYCVCYLGNQKSIVVSNVPNLSGIFLTLYKVSVQQVVKEQLWKVDMNMRMGKGYHPTKTSIMNTGFRLVDNNSVSTSEYLPVYEVLSV